jgi:addiction module HigA family antidote
MIKEDDITISNAAQDLGISRKTLSEIIHGKCAITPEMAVRIGSVHYLSHI